MNCDSCVVMMRWLADTAFSLCGTGTPMHPDELPSRNKIGISGASFMMDILLCGRGAFASLTLLDAGVFQNHAGTELFNMLAKFTVNGLDEGVGEQVLGNRTAMNSIRQEEVMRVVGGDVAVDLDTADFESVFRENPMHQSVHIRHRDSIAGIGQNA